MHLTSFITYCIADDAMIYMISIQI